MLRLQSYLRDIRLLPYACLFMASAPAQESVLDKEITVCIESPQGYHEAFQLLQEQYLELILCFECALLPEDPIVPTIDLQSVTVAEALDDITAALEPAGVYGWYEDPQGSNLIHIASTIPGAQFACLDRIIAHFQVRGADLPEALGELLRAPELRDLKAGYSHKGAPYGPLDMDLHNCTLRRILNEIALAAGHQIGWSVCGSDQNRPNFSFGRFGRPDPRLQAPPPPSRQHIEAQIRDLYRYVEQQGGPSWEVFRKSPDFEEEMSRRLEDGQAFQEHTVLGGDWAAFQDAPELKAALREAEAFVGTDTREAVTRYERLLRQTTDQHQKAAIEFRIADIYYHILNAGWVPNPAEAKRRFEAIVDRHAPLCPEVIRSHYWLGDINFKNRNFSGAREHYLAVRQAQETVEAAPEQYPPLSRHWAELLGRNVGQWLRAVDNAEVMAKTGSKPDSEPVDWAVVWRAVAERGTLPKTVMASLRELAAEAKTQQGNAWLETQRRIFLALERALDRPGAHGTLTQPHKAHLVREAIYNRQQRQIWDMFEYVIMPNHIHLLFQLTSGNLSHHGKLQAFHQ